jgi:hypothetical protein
MRLRVPGDRMLPGSCRTGENGGSEDRYRGRFFCSLARLVKQGPPLWRLLASPSHRTKPIAVRSRARRDSDGQQRHDGCHHEVPPEPCCVCSPTDRARRVFACPGPRVGSLVSPRSGAISLTLLRNLRLMATATGEDALVSARLMPRGRKSAAYRSASCCAAPARPVLGGVLYIEVCLSGRVRVMRASRRGVGHRTSETQPSFSRPQISRAETSIWPRSTP